MKACLIILWLAACGAASSQDLTDSLSKYSYLIQAGKGKSRTQATGFFARYQNRLFFVTAAHCVTGWDPFRFRRVDNSPDTLHIRLSNDTAKLRYLPLPVANIKATAQPFREYESPDVYVVEIGNARAYPVLSVEKYFNERVRCDKIASLWVFGFPLRGDGNDYLLDRQQPFTASALPGEAYCVYVFRPEARRPDPLNYFAYLKDGVAGPGLSGAPVFLLTDEKRIAFGGLYIGGADNGLRTGMVVRPEYVMEKIALKVKEK